MSDTKKDEYAKKMVEGGGVNWCQTPDNCGSNLGLRQGFYGVFDNIIEWYVPNAN
jgi:hypothetical protein